MNFTNFSPSNHWRLTLALVFFSCGLAGFISGVEVTERDVVDASILTQMYYTLGLFILGGMDLGVPVEGPAWGQALLWIGYFGAPVLTASTIVDWVQQIISHEDRQLRALSNHIVVIGTDELVHSVLEKLEEHSPGVPLLIVDRHITQQLAQEFRTRYGALVLEGDYTNDFFLTRLRLKLARRVVLIAENDFDNFEVASKILEIRPALGDRILLHCNRLRFMREVQHSQVVQECVTFNSYHLAATQLVRNQMMAHFRETEYLDTVVLAGFGRFGQTILEELQKVALNEIKAIGIIDSDAQRRILVAREQTEISAQFNLHIIEGDIGHPEVWQRLAENISLSGGRPLVLVATGNDDENLRTGLWLKKTYPNTETMIRSARPSHFSESVSGRAGVYTFGISQIINEAMPDEWFD